MRIRVALVFTLVLTLGACGVVGGDDPKPQPTASAAGEKAMDGALPQIPDGEPAPAALSDFTCSRDDDPSTGSGDAKDTWSASGAVSNGTKKPATFQVTVHVGPADGRGAAARTKRITAVQPKGSVSFDLGDIESRSSDGPCHVQVLALDS
ncbi:MAG: hypothetical protein ACR2FE_01105 [Aeromicrobium sp.]